MLRVFYFSGTGNARNVALWLAEAYRARGLRGEVRDLAKLDVRTVRIEAEDEVAFSSPTHGFNYPPITLSFILHFPKAPNRNRVALFNTRAGIRLFRLPIPGLSGVALLLSALVLLIKGYRIVAMRPIDLPSNWISLHPGLGEASVDALYERCRRITLRVSERLLEGGRDFRGLWDLPQDLLVAPIGLGYYVVGRFVLAKSFVASRSCDACGVCIKQCPTGSIRLVDGRPFWSFSCESCMRCMNQCPRRAIETAHGFLVLLIVLFGLAMDRLLAGPLTSLVPWIRERGLIPTILRNVLESLLFLTMTALGYRGLHYARRFRIVDWVTVTTALTHFRFWRRFHSPKPAARHLPQVPAEPKG